MVVVALVIVARVAERPTTVSKFAHNVANTFKLVIDEVEIVVVPRVVVPADRLPATVFVRVALVIVASDKLAVPAAIVAVAIVVVPETRFAILAFVAVALVIVAADKLAVPAAIVAVAIVVVAKLAVPVAEILFSAKFPVEVALVIVAFSAVNPNTFRTCVNKLVMLAQTIDDDETVVVANVEVPDDVIVVRFAFVPETLVTVALVIVASDKFAVPPLIVATEIVVVARDVVPVLVNTPVVVE